MSAPGDADPRGVAPDPLLVDELRGFRALLSPREADGNPILLYREGGETEQTTRNLRAVLWDAAVKIEAYATALAASKADRAALERRVAELEGQFLPGGDSGRILQLIKPGKWQVHEIVERAAPLERRRVYSAVDRLIKIGFAVRHKYGTVEIFAARALTPGASS